MNLTILIACLEKPEMVALSIEKNNEIFSKYPVIVVNKRGGELFKMFALLYFDQNTSFWFARRFGMEFVKTKYVLCLDVDTVLPPEYIEKAIEILETQQNVGVIALNYDNLHPQDHLGFGTSIWRIEQLKKLYDWRLTEGQPFNICECKYMWKKLEKNNMSVKTLPMEAIHLKDQKTYIGEEHYNSRDAK